MMIVKYLSIIIFTKFISYKFIFDETDKSNIGLLHVAVVLQKETYTPCSCCLVLYYIYIRSIQCLYRVNIVFILGNHCIYTR